MKVLPNFGDRRQNSFCIYCGGFVETQDHIPSKVFMDEPFPPDVPTIGACTSCNNGFSFDEEYLACLIECVRVGSSNPDKMEREKVRRILERKPALEHMLANARVEKDGQVFFAADKQRVKNVLLKLGRGHVAYEMNAPQLYDPLMFEYSALDSLVKQTRVRFETPPLASIWPEVGSRSMQRIVVSPNGASSQWIHVQESRYRYLATPDSKGHFLVRIVISEYLACEMIWS